MPEYVIALIISTILGSYGFIFRKIDSIDNRIDKLELKVAETYVTKEDMEKEFNYLFNTLRRMEEKIDAHIFGDYQQINRLKQKYHND